MADYYKNRLYAITISPPHKPRINPLVLHDEYTQRLHRLFNKFSKHYALYPEFADGSNRLHYHGVFKIDDMIKYTRTKHEIDKIGFVKAERFRSATDHLRYLVYSQKHYNEIKESYDIIVYKKNKRYKKYDNIVLSDLDNSKSKKISKFEQYGFSFYYSEC